MVLINSFSDEAGGVTRHPMAPNWPLETHSTFTFEDVGGGKTKVTIRWSPHNATEDERKTFEAGRDSMRQGWGGTLDRLADSDRDAIEDALAVEQGELGPSAVRRFLDRQQPQRSPLLQVAQPLVKVRHRQVLPRAAQRLEQLRERAVARRSGLLPVIEIVEGRRRPWHP